MSVERDLWYGNVFDCCRARLLFLFRRCGMSQSTIPWLFEHVLLKLGPKDVAVKEMLKNTTGEVGGQSGESCQAPTWQTLISDLSTTPLMFDHYFRMKKVTKFGSKRDRLSKWQPFTWLPYVEVLSNFQRQYDYYKSEFETSGSEGKFKQPTSERPSFFSVSGMKKKLPLFSMGFKEKFKLKKSGGFEPPKLMYLDN